ncbi:MAG: glycosyltransferase family 4 protein [Actinomycetota bacterium]|nr:glycosyltransferase family 4 protein [Actinomycetota bacterium]
MHVAVIATNYPPHRGGVEQHLAALGRRLVARGVRCTVVCLGADPAERVEDGVTVRTLRRRLDLGQVLAVPDPAAWRRTTRDLSRAGVTHISTHTRFFPMSLLGVRLAARLGVPSVHTEHGAGSVRTGRAAMDRGAELVDRTLGRRVLSRATTVLAVSARSAQFVNDLSGRTAEVIGNAVDLAAWRPAEPPAPQRRLVFAGRLAREKGWADFLDAVESVRDLQGVSAVVAGAGADLPAVRRAVADRQLAGLVHVAGPLETAELAQQLAGAVYVNPSRAAEGFQLTQLEAAAAGAQVVTYDVGVARELAASGAPVIVVPDGDVAALARATRAALTDPQPAATPEQLRQWDWETLADRYLDVLQRVSVPTLDAQGRG